MITFPDITNALKPNTGKPPVNYTRTSDPNVYIGKNGVNITRQQYAVNQKSGLTFNSFKNYADWVGGWAKNVPYAWQPSKYYRTYAGDNINGGDIALLHAKYQNNPQVMQILTRNIAKQGEVPMYSADDADAIKKLLGAQ